MKNKKFQMTKLHFTIEWVIRLLTVVICCTPWIICLSTSSVVLNHEN